MWLELRSGNDNKATMNDKTHSTAPPPATLREKLFNNLLTGGGGGDVS